MGEDVELLGLVQKWTTLDKAEFDACEELGKAEDAFFNRTVPQRTVERARRQADDVGSRAYLVLAEVYETRCDTLKGAGAVLRTILQAEGWIQDDKALQKALTHVLDVVDRHSTSLGRVRSIRRRAGAEKLPITRR